MFFARSPMSRPLITSYGIVTRQKLFDKLLHFHHFNHFIPYKDSNVYYVTLQGKAFS